MVGGRLVVDGGKHLLVDLRQLMRKAEAARARLTEANLPGKGLYERLENVVGTFCPGLARMPHHIDRYGSCEAH